jgi:hypothetical protein
MYLDFVQTKSMAVNSNTRKRYPKENAIGEG